MTVNVEHQRDRIDRQQRPRAARTSARAIPGERDGEYESSAAGPAPPRSPPELQPGDEGDSVRSRITGARRSGPCRRQDVGNHWSADETEEKVPVTRGKR